MWCKDGQQQCSCTTVRPGTDVRTLGSIKPRHMRVRDGHSGVADLGDAGGLEGDGGGVGREASLARVSEHGQRGRRAHHQVGLAVMVGVRQHQPAGIGPARAAGGEGQRQGGRVRGSSSLSKATHPLLSAMMRYVQYYRSDALLGSPEAVGEWRLEGEGGGCEAAVPVLHAEDQRGVPQVPLTERRAAGTPPPTATRRSRREGCVKVDVRAKAARAREVRALTARGPALAPSTPLQQLPYLVRKREMDPSPLLSVATSGYPSPSTSPLTTAIGPEPV